MDKPKSIRLDRDLTEPVSNWLLHNPGNNFSRLVNAAIRAFITSRHTTESVAVRAPVMKQPLPPYPTEQQVQEPVAAPVSGSPFSSDYYDQ